MNNYEKNQMLIHYVKVGNTSRTNENVDNANTPILSYQTSRSDPFIGVGNGIQSAEGIAKITPLNDTGNILRLEKLMAANAPDLYICLSIDGDASDFVNLGWLKSNNGNQDYDISSWIDLSKHDTVLIRCKAFSVLFGRAEIKIWWYSFLLVLVYWKFCFHMSYNP